MLVAVVLLALAPAAHAQVAWEIHDLQARRDHAVAYDAARERIVLFGGFANGPSADT